MFYYDSWFEQQYQSKQIQLNATIILTMITISIHAITMAFIDINRTCLLYLLGSKFTPAIHHQYQLYRLINPIFLHSNNTHLISNMISQIILGYPLEKSIGTKLFLFHYFTSGIAGNILSALYFIYSPSVGASGAIFGILGYRLAQHFKYGFNKQSLINYGIIIVMQLLCFADKSCHIDYMSHLGGLIIGFLFYYKQYLVIMGLTVIGIISIFQLDVQNIKIC